MNVAGGLKVPQRLQIALRVRRVSKTVPRIGNCNQLFWRGAAFIKLSAHVAGDKVIGFPVDENQGNFAPGDGFFRISLDTGNYREKREQTLKALARRMSNQVLRTGRSRTLEPMNPYERRIIHTEVQLIDGVESASIGEGMGRRVVISPVGGARRDDRRRDDRRGRGRGPKPAPVATPGREPKKDSNLPLYGKID